MEECGKARCRVTSMFDGATRLKPCPNTNRHGRGVGELCKGSSVKLPSGPA